MALCRYNASYMLKPNGFQNLGATCYFNTLLQGLLSCSSFVELFYNNRKNKRFITNPIAKHIIDYIKLSLHYKNNDKYNPSLVKYSGVICELMLKHATKRKDRILFT